MYRNLLAAFALFTLAVPGVLAGKDPKLEDYTSESGKFKVKFPGKPKPPETKDLASGPGGVQSIPVTTERADGPDKSVFSVTYADYPDSFLGVDAKTVLNGVRDGMKGKDGSIKEDKEIILDGFAQGRELRIEAGRNIIKARIYLVGTRLYQVMITYQKDYVSSKTAEEYFKSFEIVK